MSYRATVRQAIEREFGALFDELAHHGPLWALHRTARQEIGPTWLQWLFRIPFLGGTLLASRSGLRFIVIVLPALFTYIVLDKDGEFLSTESRLKLVLIGALVLATFATTVVLMLVALQRTRTAVIRRIARWSYEDIFAWSAIVIIMPALAGAVLTAELVHRNRIGADGVPAPAEIPFRTFEAFVWSLADSIPVLEIPKTLHWEPALTFTTIAGGSIVLAYKLILVLPLTQLIAGLLARAFGEPEPKPADAAAPAAEVEPAR